MLALINKKLALDPRTKDYKTSLNTLMSRIERNYEIYENCDFSLWSYEICENDKNYDIYEFSYFRKIHVYEVLTKTTKFTKLQFLRKL